MREEHDVEFSQLTTLRVGGPAAKVVIAESNHDVIDFAHSVGTTEMLVLGGGSNLVVSDDGVDVPVVQLATSGFDVVQQTDRVQLTVAAGVPWDDVVTRAVSEGWAGIEALAGIPGFVGATPIQNVGAYGQEIADVCTAVSVFDRVSGKQRRLSASDCSFEYRTSVFKQDRGRFVVLDVEFELGRTDASRPVQYDELAHVLGVSPGASAPVSAVRDAVLALRRSKGMVLDATDHDTWSAGSFFTNPILKPGEVVPPEAPHWNQPDGYNKLSAAWLIEHAGFVKGFGADIGRGAVRLSSKHTLALTNRGGATTSELLTLARLVRDGVRDKFQVELQPEPTFVGVQL